TERAQLQDGRGFTGEELDHLQVVFDEHRAFVGEGGEHAGASSLDVDRDSMAVRGSVSLANTFMTAGGRSFVEDSSLTRGRPERSARPTRPLSRGTRADGAPHR